MELRYETGEGSSYQYVVGCEKVEDVETFLWQIVMHSIDDVRCFYQASIYEALSEQPHSSGTHEQETA